jgi:integrase
MATAKKAPKRRDPGQHSLTVRGDKIQARIVTGYNDAGNPLRQSKTFSNDREGKRAAEDWLAEQRLALKSGELTAESTTLAILLPQWLESLKSKKRAVKTIDNYRHVLQQDVIPHIGSIVLTKLRVTDVQNLVNTWSALNVSNERINRNLTYLRLLINHAIRMELVGRNVATTIRGPSSEHRVLTRWTAEEVITVLVFCVETKHPLTTYIQVAIATGLRREELLGLRWADVDNKRCELRVEQAVTFHKGAASFGPPKTKASRRTIALDPGTLEALEAQRKAVADLRQHVGETWRDHDLVFPSNVGTPLPESRLGKSFRALCVAAAVTKIRPYDLRSTWASLADEAGLSIKQIQDRLGHTSAKMALASYIRISDAGRRGAALPLSTLTKRATPDGPPEPEDYAN